ncbi:glycine N-acyltransferase-like [Hetaerina americana]|uniref:glycine N-acyltransferase-like n=1 Tax=Hetaerina americana TaxID=62018 RepID=UPI003A7F3678
MAESRKESIINERWSSIQHEEVESVLKILSNSWPASLQIHNFIKSSFLWQSHNPEVRTTVLRKLSNGVESIIAILKINEEKIVTVYSLNGPDPDIASALCGDSIINWHEGPVLLSCIPKQLCQSITEAMIVSCKKIKKNNFNSFWLPAETAKQIDVQCPEDMYLSKLEPSHAATVVYHWPYAKEDTINIVTQMINIFDTVGIFTKDSKLVSWVMNTFYGVGMLHTIEEYRMKGYGSIVVQQLVKSLGNKGINSYLSARPDNHAAQSLFVNMGFKQLEEVEFMRME